MESRSNLLALQPRILKYRSHYRYYFYVLFSIAVLLLSFWSYKTLSTSWSETWTQYHYELKISFLYCALVGSLYGIWLRSRSHRSVQVYADHIFFNSPNGQVKIMMESIDSVSIVCWSIFYCKLKDGSKYYFSSSLERVDYVWEGIYAARPDLFLKHEYDEYRLQLIQYDHHQKRKEWFFRHKMIDLFNWIVVPFIFVSSAYIVQTEVFQIHNRGMYFFRLGMYSFLVLFVCTFIYSFVVKKFIFDKRVKFSLPGEEKIRNLEFEGVVVHRTKIFQLFTILLLFGGIIKSDLNMFSITKIHENVSSFKFKKGQTLIVDNRFNCLDCSHALQEGDIILFGKGTLGEIIAREGELVAQFYEDKTGRHIASESVIDVPLDHVAVKLANQKEVVMVRETDLLGKIQN